MSRRTSSSSATTAAGKGAGAKRTPAAGRGRAAAATGTSREPSQLRVRPYLLTGGRTSSEIDLTLETMLQITEQGTASRRTLTLEPRQIVDTCHESPIPLVELAAKLALPFQVARVLVGDLITEGFLAVAETSRSTSERPDLGLLERVLDGLQNL